MLTTRLSRHFYFLQIACLSAQRGTCVRRQVGCVLVDHNNHVMATGYNGTPKGGRHCIDSPCPGAKCSSGEGLDKCEAIHAEQNALLQCRDTSRIKAVYCTDFPCITCTKLLLNTSCKTIHYIRRYSQQDQSELMWQAFGNEVNQIHIPFPVTIMNLRPDHHGS